MEVANTVAYYNMVKITAVRSFKVQAPGVLLAHFIYFVTYKWDQ